MRAQRIAIGDNYINNNTACWEDCPFGVTPVPAATGLLVEGNVGIGTASPTSTLYVAGTFTATGTKSFEIEHPTKPGYKLVHSTLEGPEAAVFYRGETRLKDGQVVIQLPDYFEALTRKESRTVQLTPKGTEPYLLSATEVSEGKFKVYGTKPDGEFYWEVKAVRADVEPLRVEKPKEQGTG